MEGVLGRRGQPGLDARQVEDLAEKIVHRLGRAADQIHQLALFAREAGVGQHVGQAGHAVQGRADLVAHIGQELALGAAGGLGLGERRGQRLGVALQFGDVNPHADHAAVAGRRVLDTHPLAAGEFELDGLAVAPLALALEHPGFVVAVGEDHVVEQQPLFERHRMMRAQSLVGSVPHHQPVVGVVHGQGGGHGVGGRAQLGDGAATMHGFDQAHHRGPQQDQQGDGQHHGG